MDMDKAREYLMLCGNPTISIKGGAKIRFARADMSTAERIQAMGNVELVSNWKSSVWITYIYGQSSISDLQFIRLCEMEMYCRPDIDIDVLNAWFEQASAEFDPDAFNA